MPNPALDPMRAEHTASSQNCHMQVKKLNIGERQADVSGVDFDDWNKFLGICQALGERHMPLHH